MQHLRTENCFDFRPSADQASLLILGMSGYEFRADPARQAERPRHTPVNPMDLPGHGP